MESTVKCICKENHKEHLCELFRTGQVESLELSTDDPWYMCLSCGAEASFSECLCTPDSLYKDEAQI